MNKQKTEKENQELILVIEDDVSLRQGLVMNFELQGYRVRSASDGQEGMRLAFDLRPDLIVLDIMLPVFSGMEILDELRQRNENVPVLILSARGTTDNKVQGLKKGADDYLTKPFELSELLARVEAMLRRKKAENNTRPSMILGDLKIEPATRRVILGDKELSLSAKEFDLLNLLASSPGRVFSREKIINKVWGWNFDGTSRTVDNYILSLRQKIEPNPSRPKLIKTIRQVGYRLDAPKANK